MLINTCVGVRFENVYMYLKSLQQPKYQYLETQNILILIIATISSTHFRSVHQHTYKCVKYYFTILHT